jgi:pimeloyl-ACP methyl ester carboxylesterase
LRRRERVSFLERLPVTAGLVVVILLGIWASATAAGATTLRACGDHGRLTCGKVSAPLDPSGRVHGRVSLYVERYAAVSHPTGTLVALAGGPGQAAVPLLDDFREVFKSVLGSRALVVFDERGIGRSGRLDCTVSKEDELAGSPAGSLIGACARNLGSRGRFYSSDDTVSDIETIRRTLRLGRIDLYGVSYGTFPATQYARRYPSNIAHLVLDSTLPADGDSDTKLNSITSIRRQLASICPTVCPTLDPAADLGTLLAGLPRKASGFGPTSISREEGGVLVLSALYASDLDPFVRASIPAALHLGATGDRSAVVRLGAIASASEAAEGYDEAPTDPASGTEHSHSATINAEGIATRCEDERFVWSVGDSLAVRHEKVLAEQRALTAAEVAPFSRATVMAASGIAECEHWPTAGAHPAREPGPLPQVPTLILSGGDDVRTPLEQAAMLAGQIPGSTLLAVPGVGHSVVGTDPSGCAKRALAALLGGGPILPCTAGPQTPVDPLPPASFATLAPSGGLTGEAGEVLSASVLTLRHDVGFSAPYAFLGFEVPGTVAGGLIDLPVDGHDGTVLEDISYVRSVSLSGPLKVASTGLGTGRLSVRVGGHVYGTLQLESTGTITGTLGGRSFRLANAARQAIDIENGLGFYTQLR